MALTQCPDCKTQVSDKALSCPKCGRHIKDKPRKSSCLGIGCMGLVLLVIGSAVWSSYKEPTGSTPQAAVQSDKSPRTGSDAYLYMSGTSSVLLAVSEKAHGELIDRCRARDTIGMLKMIGAGTVFEVESGSKVRVTGTAMFLRRVRVMDSDSQAFGKEGWATMESVHAGPQ